MTGKHLVVSAVNLVEGGTLAVLRDCLTAARAGLGPEWRITALVHRASLVGVPGIDYVERPEIKRSWFARLWFEYVACRSLSRELDADFWFALHDMSPVVVTPRQAVYCHNAMCFYRMSLREVLLDPKLLLFSTLYASLYRINLRANAAVVVQQDWIRREFETRFGARNVIVSHPVIPAADTPARPQGRGGRTFLYPSFPRFFKNFETLLRAWQILCADEAWDGRLIVTIDGSENRYARWLLKQFRGLRNVDFTGRLSHDAVQQAYARSDCLVFPSRLETWGLPLSEAKQHGLAILAADLPYAHEAVGHCDSAAFFPPRDAERLAHLMRQFAQGELTFAACRPAPIQPPFAGNWAALLDLLLTHPTESVPPQAAANLPSP